MKTLNRKNHNKKNPTGKDSIGQLVDDPNGNQILNQTVSDKNAAFVSDLISLKKSNEEINRSASLLISAISICLSLLMTIGMFEWKTIENGASVNLESRDQNFDDLFEIPQTEQIPKPPVKIQAPVIIEVNDEEIIEEIEINLDIEMTEETRIEQVIFSLEIETMPEEQVDEIFTIVEVQPTPVGGIKAFYNYISQNLIYPNGAKRMGIEGRVFIEFVVEKDGSLTDIKVVKGIGGGCDMEAIRVLSNAPSWEPGKQRGRAVRVRMILPIMFRLE